MTTQDIGTWGESIAAEFLAQLGYEIIERNWHSREGELDLVARDRDVLVFVEVKVRGGDRFGTPEEAVTKTKQRRLQRAAWRYLMATRQESSEWRIDVIAIERDPNGQVARLDHYLNAVHAAEDLGSR